MIKLLRKIINPLYASNKSKLKNCISKQNFKVQKAATDTVNPLYLPFCKTFENCSNKLIQCILALTECQRKALGVVIKEEVNNNDQEKKENRINPKSIPLEKLHCVASEKENSGKSKTVTNLTLIKSDVKNSETKESKEYKPGNSKKDLIKPLEGCVICPESTKVKSKQPSQTPSPEDASESSQVRDDSRCVHYRYLETFGTESEKQKFKVQKTVTDSVNPLYLLFCKKFESCTNKIIDCILALTESQRKALDVILKTKAEVNKTKQKMKESNFNPKSVALEILYCDASKKDGTKKSKLAKTPTLKKGVFSDQKICATIELKKCNPKIPRKYLKQPSEVYVFKPKNKKEKPKEPSTVPSPLSPGDERESSEVGDDIRCIHYRYLEPFDRESEKQKLKDQKAVDETVNPFYLSLRKNFEGFTNKISKCTLTLLGSQRKAIMDRLFESKTEVKKVNQTKSVVKPKTSIYPSEPYVYCRERQKVKPRKSNPIQPSDDESESSKLGGDIRCIHYRYLESAPNESDELKSSLGRPQVKPRNQK